MTNIPHLTIDCQEDIYIDGAGIVRRHSSRRPIDTPLANCAALADDGQPVCYDPPDVADDGEPVAVWIEPWELEPEWNFFEDEVIT